MEAATLGLSITVEEKNKILEHTVRTEGGRLRQFIQRRVADPEDAEDILQDVFLRLTNQFNLEIPVEKIASWLFTVARNRIIDWYRKRRPERMAALPVEEYEDENSPSEINLISEGLNPEELYYREFVWTEIASALEKLPVAQREVFIQHELEGKSFKEISEVSGVQVNTLLSRKRYAVQQLREQLKELYTEFFES